MLPGGPGQPASSAASRATGDQGEAAAAHQPVDRGPGQDGGTDQAEQRQAVRFTEGGQPGQPDQPGVRHQQGYLLPVPGLGERYELAIPQVKGGAEGQRGAAQPQHAKGPGTAAVPAHRQAERRERGQHHAERGEPFVRGVLVIDAGEAGQPVVGQPR
jgi:hypothetical protein